MMEFLNKFDGGELIGLVAVAGGLLIGLLCGLTAIITDAWVKVHKLAFKQDMLSRGMSADEIHAVLAAGTKRGCKGFPTPQSARG